MTVCRSLPGRRKSSGRPASSLTPGTLRGVLASHPYDAMEAYGVSTLVNSAAKDEQEVVARLA